MLRARDRVDQSSAAARSYLCEYLLTTFVLSVLNATAGHAFRSYGHAFTLSPLAWESNAAIFFGRASAHQI